LITPNIPEASVLSGSSHKELGGYGGGRGQTPLFRVYLTWLLREATSTVKQLGTYFAQPQLGSGSNTGGCTPRIIMVLGCTLSSAVAAELAKGNPPLRAYAKARRFLQKALERSLNIGRGYGPLNPMYNLPGFREE